jgi:hypothetical protein
MIWHILPTNDSEEHLEKSTCKCLPNSEIVENGDLLIVHNSFDNREIIEWVNEILT